MREIVKSLREQGKTILISSHILPELAEMCDEIGIIQKGALVACAAVEVVAARVSGQRQIAFDLMGGGYKLADGILRYSAVTDILSVSDLCVEVLFKGSDQDQVRLVHDLAVAGYAIKTVREVGGNLEELFLRLTESSNDDPRSIPKMAGAM